MEVNEKNEHTEENEHTEKDKTRKGTGKSKRFLKFERVVIFLLFTTDPACHTSQRRTAIAYHKPPH